MDIELDEVLVARYPLLYRDRYGDKMGTLMCWGFSCGDGWFDIIDNLSAKLETEIKEMMIDGTPFNELPVAVQVKEKFGGLRFYMHGATKSMSDTIEEAEIESITICEYCGKPGELRNDRSWVKTLCDKCASK